MTKMTMKIAGLQEAYELFVGIDRGTLIKLAFMKNTFTKPGETLASACRTLDRDLRVDTMTCTVLPDSGIDGHLAQIFTLAVSAARTAKLETREEVFAYFASVHERKNQIFRDRYLGTGLAGVVVRIGDQATRLGEGRPATIAHIANYALMGMGILVGSKMFFEEELRSLRAKEGAV